MSRMRRKRILLLAGPGSRQPFLLTLAGLQVHHPYASARRVISAVIVLDHRTPRLEGAHCKRDSLEIVTRVVQHFVGMPIVRQNGVTRVHAHHGVVAVKCRFGPHVARGATLLSFGDDITLLRFGSRRRWSCCCFGVHRVCATCSAAAAEAIAITFFGSAA